MTKEKVIRIAQGLITDFKCESDTMVDFCNTIIRIFEQETILDKSHIEGDYIQGYKKKDMDKVLEMATDIINLELRLIKNNIRGGNCPFAISPLKNRLNIDCSTTDCRDCNNMWAKAKRKEIAEEVIARYDLQESFDEYEQQKRKVQNEEIEMQDEEIER